MLSNPPLLARAKPPIRPFHSHFHLPTPPLHRQTHNRIHNIHVMLMQRLNRFLPRHPRLRHHQLDILSLQPRIVDLLAIILIIVGALFPVPGANGFPFAVVRVVVAGVGVCDVRGGAFLLGELLDRGGLGLGVEVFDFGFAENAGWGVGLVREARDGEGRGHTSRCC